MTAKKEANEIKQKARQTCHGDMKKLLYGRYPQRKDNGNVDKATTN